MTCIQSTLDTLHLLRSWLKAEAWANMFRVRVTLDTSHLLRAWLKAEAVSNIPSMLVMLDNTSLAALRHHPNMTPTQDLARAIDQQTGQA